MRPIRSFVVARSENCVIGCETGVPWKLSSDLKIFRRLTIDHPIIMGRKTFESIGHPLDRRDNIVVSRDPMFNTAGITVAHDRVSALRLGDAAARRRGKNEVMIIGGAEIYRLFEDAVDIVYLTEVRAHVEGNARFDKDFSGWTVHARHEVPRSASDEYPFTLRLLLNPESSLARDSTGLSKAQERMPAGALEFA